MSTTEPEPPRRLPPEALLELVQLKHMNWRRWVAGDIRGYPDDESALNRAQEEASQRFREREAQ